MFVPLQFALTLLGAKVDRARRLEGGASAVEWVIIAAIVVGICLIVGNILLGALQNSARNIGDDIENPGIGGG
ncbi:hypothetical protein D9V41_03630 [Aeromicrobium phragmitis]|uniref:Flp family type IVb pilin n=1 Tax=Aeromicrobium phragmitis TaxID=2478914 RepID=A0A3L8PQH5_9ACTN|nr:hypothetical protein [Aeromicrobium phragmitis]RLV56873.1 hypothetical protein D9V41_03630 [Aeromicrobium phragmitis]